ncbi:MAG TPA: ABC transporter ATP-binding protein [Planctomycetota bacterium]|nr:ABC transporter ATP-binding protein [Planctomycetota bacterium]
MSEGGGGGGSGAGGPLVELRRVRRLFEGGRVHALDGIDLALHRGEFVAVTGPSGSGKTTLLNLMGAMDLPDEGEVYFEGTRIDSARAMERVRAERIGFVFQMHNLIPVLRAAENVEVPLVPRMPRAARRERAVRLLGEVGLGHRADADVRGLSGGERQRVAIARALANEPALILADEPTGNLDSRTGHEVMEVLHAARRRTGATLVLVTHNLEICEGCDRHVKLHDGRIEA